MEQEKPTPRLVTAIRVLIVLALIPVVLHLWMNMWWGGFEHYWDLFQIGNDVGG
jgi:hypothetical protein